MVEAIHNATKQAGPGARVVVALERTGRDLSFSVADDGVGFDAGQPGDDPGQPGDGVRLVSMRDRICAAGGTLDVSSQPGHGTIVYGVVPSG